MFGLTATHRRAPLLRGPNMKLQVLLTKPISPSSRHTRQPEPAAPAVTALSVKKPGSRKDVTGGARVWVRAEGRDAG